MNTFLYVVKHLGIYNTSKLLWTRMLSFNHYYILNINLKRIPSIVSLKIPAGKLKLINQEDLSEIKKQISILNGEDKKEILSRLLFYKSGFTNCYVYKVNNKIAYIQWIILPSENEIIRKHYKRRYYPLTKNQIMVENVFTFPKFRGYGLLPSITIRVLNLAKEKGYKSGICYVRKERIAPLNESIKIGFKITKMIKEFKIFGYVWRTL